MGWMQLVLALGAIAISVGFLLKGDAPAVAPGVATAVKATVAPGVATTVKDDDAVAAADGDDAVSAADGNDAAATADGNDATTAVDGDDAVSVADGDDAAAAADGDDGVAVNDSDVGDEVMAPAQLCLDCSLCRIPTLPSQDSLVRHRMKHYNKRKDRCSICGRRFKDATVFNKHRCRPNSI